MRQARRCRRRDRGAARRRPRTLLRPSRPARRRRRRATARTAGSRGVRGTAAGRRRRSGGRYDGHRRAWMALAKLGETGARFRYVRLELDGAMLGGVFGQNALASTLTDRTTFAIADPLERTPRVGRRLADDDF